MNIHNILLATDFSQSSGAALQLARFIANHYRARLLIVHVISESVYRDVPPELLDEAKAHTTADARTKLERFRQVANDISTESLLEEGPVADTLLGLAESQHVDLLVAGARGHNRIERLLLGSVAEKLSRQSRCPVLIVPESASSYDIEFVLRTVLCPTNFSERSVAALKQAWDLAQSFSARILLLHVVEDSALSRADRIEKRSAIEPRLTGLTSSLSCGRASPEVEFIVEFGPVPQTITRVAAERQASLVVLSIQRDKPVVAHLPPKITYSVAQRLFCPVLTIAS